MMKTKINMKKEILVVITTILLLSSFMLGSFTAAGLKHINNERPIKTNATFSEHYKPQIKYRQLYSGWPQTYDGGDEDSAWGGIAIDSNGGIIVTGYSFVDEANSNIITIKYDDGGNEIWQSSFDKGSIEFAMDLAIDSKDNIIIFGFKCTSLDDLEDLNLTLLVVKYNSDGFEQWNLSYHFEKDNFPGGVAIDSNDNIILTGGKGNINQMFFSCWTMKMDENGNEEWNKTFTEDMISIGTDVAVNSNDEIIVGGVSASPMVGQGFCIIKYDNDGNKISVNRYGGIQPNGIAIDSHDNIILTGQHQESDSDSSIWYTLKSDKNGNELWVRQYDSGNNDIAENVAIDAHDNIITVGGSHFSQEEFFEHCTIIYDENGEEICMKRPGISGFIYGVAVDNTNTIIITGDAVIDNNLDYYTNKYSDTAPPLVHLETPKEKYLYIFGKEIIPLSKNTFIIGQITIKLEADDPSDVEKVELYIDNTLQETMSAPPYEGIWSELTFGKHRIITMAYDNTGSIARNEIEVWKFF